MCSVTHVQLFATPRTVAHQAPLSMEFFRQEYWSGLPFPILGNSPDAEIEPMSLVSRAFAGRSLTTALPGKPKVILFPFYRKNPRKAQQYCWANKGEMSFGRLKQLYFVEQNTKVLGQFRGRISEIPIWVPFNNELYTEMLRHNMKTLQD